MKNKTDRAKECQFCSKEHTDWEKECKYWGRPPLKVTDCNCNCHCKGGPCKSSHSHYCQHCNPEETAHSGLIDTPTAQKRQKVVESKVSRLEGHIGNPEVIAMIKESKVSEWEEEFDKRTHPFITYEEMKSIISDILHKYFIPKKELAEMLGKKRTMRIAIKTGSDAGAGHTIGHNALRQKIIDKFGI